LVIPGFSSTIAATASGLSPQESRVHYQTSINDHGMKHDPFKAIVVPRPVGWIGTLSAQGIPNLAPYSFFNAVSDKPPMVMFSSAGIKDSVRNVLDTGEFSCSFASLALVRGMNLSAAPVRPEADEFELAGLEAAPSRYIRAPRVAASPAALECRLWKMIELPQSPRATVPWFMVIGEVVGIYIADEAIHDGRFDAAGQRPLARMGYMDYMAVDPATVFELTQPTATEDGMGLIERTGPWDGTYQKPGGRD
jgi:flavin reductase (DIM6/NTAB) family NADH-FMN oxidoreductase RutF